MSTLFNCAHSLAIKPGFLGGVSALGPYLQMGTSGRGRDRFRGGVGCGVWGPSSGVSDFYYSLIVLLLPQAALQKFGTSCWVEPSTSMEIQLHLQLGKAAFSPPPPPGPVSICRITPMCCECIGVILQMETGPGWRGGGGMAYTTAAAAE
jgi:hypothetical protein